MGFAAGELLPKSRAVEPQSLEQRTVKSAEDPSSATRTGRTLAPQKHKKKKRARLHTGVGVVASSGMPIADATEKKANVAEDLLTVTDPLAGMDAEFS